MLIGARFSIDVYESIGCHPDPAFTKTEAGSFNGQGYKEKDEALGMNMFHNNNLFSVRTTSYLISCTTTHKVDFQFKRFSLTWLIDTPVPTDIVGRRYYFR